MVVDTSAAFKGVAKEDRSAEFRAWIDAARTGNVELLAPHLLRYELGACLARQGGLSPADRAQMLDALLLGFRFADAAGPAGAFEYSPPSTYYDASFLALAKSADATLVSYDDKMLKAAKKAGIATFSP